MVFVDVGDGVRLHAQDVGVGSEGTIVLVAGFGLDHEVWDRQVRVFAERGLRVVCVDQRGHGGSDKPLAGYEIPELAEDLATVLDDLDIGGCTLLGWSFAGQVAFHLAATRPRCVSRLVLVGSNAVRASRSDSFPFGRDPEPMLSALLAAERDDRIAARRTTIASGFASKPEPALLDWLLRCSLRMPSWSAVACYRSMMCTDLMDDLVAVRLPVLQVIGARDPVHSAKGARWLAERLTDARLVEIPDCGHYPMLETPAALEDAVLAFAGIRT